MKSVRCRIHDIDFMTSCPVCVVDAMGGPSFIDITAWIDEANEEEMKMQFKNRNMVGGPRIGRDRFVVCENCSSVYGDHYGLRCPKSPRLSAAQEPQPSFTDVRGRIEPTPLLTCESVSYIGEAPVGAKLMAFGDKVFMVATGMAPHWVTPTGLVLMQRADGGEN